MDDHPVVREGLVAMLASQEDIKVVAQAENGQEAINLYKTTRPDLVLTDLHMPDLEGEEVIRQIKEEQPEVKFLVLTAYDTDDRIMGAIRAGALGYLVKGAPKQQLFDAIRTVYEGGSLLGPGIAPKLLGIMNALGADRSTGLTEREMEVLKLTSDGLRNKEIASRLSISQRTVKFHLTAVFQKLGVSSRTEAVKEAARRGIVAV